MTTLETRTGPPSRRAARAAERLEIRAATAEADRAEQAERRTERRRRRDAQRMRREMWAATLVAALRNFRPVAPLLVVNAFAVLGQYLTGVDNYSPADWSPAARVSVAIGAAVGFESISLYVQWHAQDALLMGATHTAARLRRAAYLIAFGAAAVSYHHFADGWLQPTPASIVFATFSAVSPWLWGLHTRRVQRIQLLREGQVDSTGAVFSAERWRAFPVRTWKARRLSIDLGVSDPLRAWVAFKAIAAAAKHDEPDTDVTAPIPIGVGPDGDIVTATLTNPATVAELLASLPAPIPAVPAASGSDLDTARQLLREGAGSPTLQETLRISDYAARQLVKMQPEEITQRLLDDWQARERQKRDTAT